MSFKVLTTSDFKRDSKGLLKKYKSFKNELLDLIASLEENPTQGTPPGNDCYKIRLAIASKGKGKSDVGARLAQRNACPFIAESQFQAAPSFLYSLWPNYTNNIPAHLQSQLRQDCYEYNLTSDL
jgi:hypothetical protein